MVKVWNFIPFSTKKNLGEEYNAYMELIPDTDAACFTDGDVMFLTPDFGYILQECANKYTNAVLTCFTNRIHELAKGQRLPDSVTDEFSRDNIRRCIGVAEILAENNGISVTPLDGPVSGFLLVVPKSVWIKHKFTEENKYRPGQPNLLGVDNEFTNKVRQAGVPVLRIDGLLVWHSYRLLTGSKQHLL